jgi:cell division transport system permease protein
MPNAQLPITNYYFKFSMLKFLTKLDYLLKETFLGLLRGGWMNWATVSTVTVLLFLFGLSLQTSWQVERLLKHFGSQLQLSVYLESGIQAVNIEPLVANMPEVASVEVITKEQAWTKLVKELGSTDIEGANQQLGGNPLVDEMKVKALNPQVVPNLATRLAKLQGVDVVRYIHEAVKRIAQLHRGLSWITLNHYHYFDFNCDHSDNDNYSLDCHGTSSGN